MRILALETSSLHGSLAAAEDSSLVLEQPLGHEMRTAVSLAPALQHMLNELGWAPSTLDLIAVTVGPGSFTGLRIGVTTAKTLAYAVNARVVGVNTLEALAVAAAEHVPAGEAILPLIDAHRNQLFAARYQRQADGRVVPETNVEIVDLDPWLAALQPSEYLTGPVLTKIEFEIQERWPLVNLCPQAVWTPSAAAVAHIAAQRAAHEAYDDLFALLPKYYRLSYAEEKARTK